MMRIERADTVTVGEAVPLLRTQLMEHGIAVDDATFGMVVRGLVEVEGRGAVLLARADGGTVIGVAVLAYTWTIEHGGPCAWLDELYVVPEMREAGLGTALLRHAIAVAREEGRRAIDLEVDVDHARAEALYRREGFESLSRRRFARTL